MWLKSTLLAFKKFVQVVQLGVDVEGGATFKTTSFKKYLYATIQSNPFTFGPLHTSSIAVVTKSVLSTPSHKEARMETWEGAEVRYDLRYTMI